MLRLPSKPPAPWGALSWFPSLTPGLLTDRYFPSPRLAATQIPATPLRVRSPLKPAHRAARLVVVKVHEEAQVPPLLPGIHKLPAEQTAEVDVVAAAPPMPIGAPRTAPPIVARAGLDGALRAGARHRMGNTRGRDGEDKCCFPTACGGRERRSARGHAGCRQHPKCRTWDPRVPRPASALGVLKARRPVVSGSWSHRESTCVGTQPRPRT